MIADEQVRKYIALMRRPYRQRLYQLRHFELLAELYLLDTGMWSEDGDQFAAIRYGQMSRDGVICAIIDWRTLLAIESVNCPGCWARPRQPCKDIAPAPGTKLVGATTQYDLPRMYHVEREKRAQRKVGLE